MAIKILVTFDEENDYGNPVDAETMRQVVDDLLGESSVIVGYSVEIAE